MDAVEIDEADNNDAILEDAVALLLGDGDEGAIILDGDDDNANGDEDEDDSDSSVEMVAVVPGVPGNGDDQHVQMLDTINLYQDYISQMISRYGLRSFSSLVDNGTITDELAFGNCGYLALVRCLKDHGCLRAIYGDFPPTMTELRSDIADFWNLWYHHFRIPSAILQPRNWRLVASYPDGSPLNCFQEGRLHTMRRRVVDRIFRRGTNYNDRAEGDQWLEMNEVLSIVALWMKYSIVVYMVDREAGLNRTYFFIYNVAENNVTHVTHSHPTNWLSPPPRSITLHYIQHQHFQSYNINVIATDLPTIHSVVQKYMWRNIAEGRLSHSDFARAIGEVNNNTAPPVLDLEVFCVTLVDGDKNELGDIVFQIDFDRLGDVLDGQQLLSDSHIFSRLMEDIELRDNGLCVTFGKPTSGPIVLRSVEEERPVNSMSRKIRVNEQHYSLMLDDNGGVLFSEAEISARIEDLVRRKDLEYETFEEAHSLQCRGSIPMIDFYSSSATSLYDSIARFQGIIFQHLAQQAVVYLYENTPMLRNEKEWNDRVIQEREERLRSLQMSPSDVMLDDSDLALGSEEGVSHENAMGGYEYRVSRLQG